MIEVLLSWGYLLGICLCIGTGACKLLSMLMWGKKESVFFSYTMFQILTAGVIAATLYAEYFSLIGKINILAHMLLLFTAVILGCINRNAVMDMIKKGIRILFSWEGFFYLCFAVFLSYFASRGEFHTDTNIYHAQMIRLYEEYGHVKGIGNLQLHFAYNSSFLAFCALFSFRWLLGRSLHTATGFLAFFFSVYAFHGLRNFKDRKEHITDFMRIGILFYLLVILVRIMSPATDFATMFFTLFVLAEWCENLEGERSMERYGILALTAVFIATMKFSAALLALLAVYPGFFYVRKCRWREILSLSGSGLVILLPFFIRNYLISGWLLYPFDGIDIFAVEWKIPKEYLLIDKQQIETWGKCLYDVSLSDTPVSQWLPIWWNVHERFEKMLIYAVIMGFLLLCITLSHRILQNKVIRWDMAVLLFVNCANIVFWFLEAPFIRYGLAFLLAVPMIALGEYTGHHWKGIYSILSGGAAFCLFIALSPYWSNYIDDAGVFLKHNLKEPYYITQKDYDDTETAYMEINGNKIFYSVKGEINSYYLFPNTCYKFMLERSTLIGDKIEDGFKAKD